MSEQKQPRSFRKFSIDKDSNKQEIVPSLYSKFLNISSKVEIQHNTSSLNILQADSTEIKPFDDKLQAVKLKQIQNKNQLLKVEAQLFKQRRLSRIRQVQSRAAASSQVETQNITLSPQSKIQFKVRAKNSISNMFKTFQDMKKSQVTVSPQILHVQEAIVTPHKAIKRRQFSNNFKSQLHQQQFEQLDKNSQGILYFNQLKKHPKLLKYTIERSKQKTTNKQQQANNLMLRSKAFADQFKKYCLQALESSPPAKTFSAQLDTSEIIQKKMRKFYSKHVPKRLSQSPVNYGMGDFVQQQKRILDSKSKRKLPKQAFSKLRQRLDGIAYEINACRRRNTSIHQIRSKSLQNNRQGV